MLFELDLGRFEFINNYTYGAHIVGYLYGHIVNFEVNEEVIKNVFPYGKLYCLV